MKTFTHISTLVPCTISLNGTKTYSLQSPLFSWTHIYSKQDFFITFMPDNKNLYLPETISTNGSQTNSIKVTPFINSHYNLIYSPQKLLQQTSDLILFEKIVGDNYIKIVENEETYIVVSNTQKGELLNKKIPALANITSETTNYLFLKCITKQNHYYVLIINLSNNNIIINNEFDIIEENNKNIKFLKFTNDIAEHGEVYVFDKNKILVDNYCVYKNTNPIFTSNNILIPQAFLECVKYEDFNLAKFYLKNNFTTNEHIKSYFGNIKEIHFNPYTNNSINYTILSDNEYKSYNFEVENNKITDIEQVKF